MQIENKSYRRIVNLVRFYSLIYGIIMLIFSVLGIIVTTWAIQSESRYGSPLLSSNIVMGPLILTISLILSGILLIITYYGLTHLKPYARFTGIFGCSIIFLGIIIEFLSQLISFTIESSGLGIIILVIPTVILIALILVFWNHLNFKENKSVTN